MECAIAGASIWDNAALATENTNLPMEIVFSSSQELMSLFAKNGIFVDVTLPICHGIKYDLALFAVLSGHFTGL